MTATLRKAHRIVGHHLVLRDAREDDAAFILALRTDERKSRHLSATQPELAAQVALATARDAAAAAEWELHNAMLGVKEQVIAQFGKNSDQLQALGLKKKTEYKAPTRKAKAA